MIHQYTRICLILYRNVICIWTHKRLKMYSTHQINFKYLSHNKSTLPDLGVNILWNKQARKQESFYSVCVFIIDKSNA